MKDDGAPNNLSRVIINLQAFWRDETSKNLLQNVTTLVSATQIVSFLNVVTMSLCIRALGIEDYGQLILIQTYVFVIINLVNCQSWQALIKFGSQDVAKGRRDVLSNLVRLCGLLDISTGFLGFLTGIAGVFLLATLGIWSDDFVFKGFSYCSVLLTAQLINTPTGLLRMSGRFNLLACHQVFAALFKLGAVFVAFQLNAGLMALLWIFIASESLEYLGLFLLGLWAFRQERLKVSFDKSVFESAKEYPGFWEFIGTSSLNSVAVRVIFQVDTLIIGTLLGAANAGYYRVIKRLGALVSNLANPTRQVVYPAIMKFVSESDYHGLRQFLLGLMAILFVGGVFLYTAFIFVGDWLIVLIISDDYKAIFSETLAYLTGAVISLWLLPVMPLFLAKGWHKAQFVIYQISAVIYILLIVLGSINFGLIGAALAYPGFYIFYSLVSGYVLSIRSNLLFVGDTANKI